MPGQNTIAQSIPALISRIVAIYEKHAKRVLEPYGLNVSQFRTLVWWYQDENVLHTTSEIQKMLGVSYISASNIVSKLEDKGLIEKLPQQSGSATRHLRLTARGRDLKVPLIKTQEELSGWLTSCLDEHELSTLIELLERVHNSCTGR